VSRLFDDEIVTALSRERCIRVRPFIDGEAAGNGRFDFNRKIMARFITIWKREFSIWRALRQVIGFGSNPAPPLRSYCDSVAEAFARFSTGF